MRPWQVQVSESGLSQVLVEERKVFGFNEHCLDVADYMVLTCQAYVKDTSQ